MMVSTDSRQDTRRTANAPDRATDQETGNRRPMQPQKARQGEIILKTSLQRWIFFGALGLAAVLGVVIAMLA
jgi:hypothetical protein